MTLMSGSWSAVGGVSRALFDRDVAKRFCLRRGIASLIRDLPRRQESATKSVKRARGKGRFYVKPAS